MLLAMWWLLFRVSKMIALNVERLGLTLQDSAAEVIAIKIIELAQRGVKTPTAPYLATIAGFKLDGRKLI